MTAYLLYNGSAKIVDVQGRYAELKPIGVYESYDLVLLSDDFGLKPLAVKDYAQPALGDFLALAGAGGKAIGFGVVSVLERSLREADKAYLGVVMNFDNVADNGVMLMQIMPGTPADRAGLMKGDRVISIGGKSLKSATETRNVIQNLKPGDQKIFKIRRGTNVLELSVVFEARQERTSKKSEKINKMELLGGAISEVRDFFPRVIQTDIQVSKNSMAAPAFNLNGKFIGLTISRSRMKTYLIPADDLIALLKTAPKRLVAQPQSNYTQRDRLQKVEPQESLRDLQNFRDSARLKRSAPNNSLAELEKELLKQFHQMGQPQQGGAQGLRAGETDRLFKLMGQMLKDDTLSPKSRFFDNNSGGKGQGNGFSFKMEFNDTAPDFNDLAKIIEAFKKIENMSQGLPKGK